MRSAMNAILYLLRTGCPWRYLPGRVFPPRSTVYNIFRAFQRRGHVGGDLGGTARGPARTAGAGGEPERRRHRQLLAQVGRKGGCAKGEADAVGYDAGKKVKGRKIHALVDTEGLPLRVVVHSAAIQDRDGAALVLDRIRQRFNWLELIWADGGYNARQVEHAVAAQPPCVWRSSNVQTTVQDLSSCRAGGSSNGPFRGSAETAVWPRTTRTLLTPSPPSSPSPASASPSGASPGRRLLNRALSARVFRGGCRAEHKVRDQVTPACDVLRCDETGRVRVET